MALERNRLFATPYNNIRLQKAKGGRK